MPTAQGKTPDGRAEDTTDFLWQLTEPNMIPPIFCSEPSEEPSGKKFNYFHPGEWGRNLINSWDVESESRRLALFHWFEVSDICFHFLHIHFLSIVISGTPKLSPENPGDRWCHKSWSDLAAEVQSSGHPGWVRGGVQAAAGEKLHAAHLQIYSFVSSLPHIVWRR